MMTFACEPTFLISSFNEINALKNGIIPLARVEIAMNSHALFTKTIIIIENYDWRDAATQHAMALSPPTLQRLDLTRTLR